MPDQTHSAPETVLHRLTETHYGSDPYRPALKGFLIPGRRGKLLAALFAAAGPGPHPTVLLFHGIPGVERNLDLAQYLRREGFHVLTFHYSGCFGSDGAYSIANDLEDAETVLDFVLNDTGCGFDKSRIYAVGHSLGGFVCGRLAARRPEIRAGVLLMPYDIGRTAQLKATDPAAYQGVVDLLNDAAPWLSGTSGEALLKEAEENEAAFSLVSVAEELSRIPLLCVTGSLDTDVPEHAFCTPLRHAVAACGGILLQYECYPTDHAFSDCRLTVAERICRFLKEADGR